MSLDLKDAYNKVNYRTMIAVMEESKIDPWIMGWIGVALRESIVALRFEGWILENKRTCTGLPEGYRLLRVLFNIYMAALA